MVIVRKRKGRSGFQVDIRGMLPNGERYPITSERVQQLKGEARHLSAKRLNNILNTVSVLLKKAVEWGKLDRMPCTVTLLPVDDQRPPEFWEPDQFEELVRSATLVGEEAQLRTLLGGDAGLRLGEIVALEWTDIDFARNVLHVQRAEWRGVVDKPKGGKTRLVPMTSRLAAALKAHRHLRETTLRYMHVVESAPARAIAALDATTGAVASEIKSVAPGGHQDLIAADCSGGTAR
jgi:integrase